MNQRISIFSTQLPELTMAGGIGQLNSRFAVFLKNLNYEVEIAIANTEIPLSRAVVSKYEKLGITVKELPTLNKLVSPHWLELQYRVQNYYEMSKPDVIISQEWQAPLTLVSAISRIPVITWLHGGTIYDKVGSKSRLESKSDLIQSLLESIQIENSTAVTSPSNFLLGFYSKYGVCHPKSQVISYPFPKIEPSLKKQAIDPKIVIAFVGSLSLRKGFDLAVAYAYKLRELGEDFTFYIGGKDSDFKSSKIIEDLKKNKINFVLRQHLSSEEIWNELSQLNTTLLVPSRLDNIPGVAYEALSSGCKVLATQDQGTLELLDSFPIYISEFDFDVTSNIEFLKSTPPSDSAESVINGINLEVAGRWKSLIDNAIVEKADSALKASQTDLNEAISVVIITKQRTGFFQNALDSVLNQTYPPAEIVVVEESGAEETSVESICRLANLQVPIKYIKIDNSKEWNFPLAHTVAIGQAHAARNRNIGTQLASHGLIAFLDDDNLFTENHLEDSLTTLVTTGADAVTSYLSQVYSDVPITQNSAHQQIAVMAGSALKGVNFLTNVSTDSSLLIQKRVLAEIGGWSEYHYPEDWALGLKLEMEGKSLVSTGKPTVVHRLNLDGIQAKLSTALDNPFSLDGLTSEIGSRLIPWQVFSLARQSFVGTQRLLQADSKSRSLGYLTYALELIQTGNFRALIFGIRKFVKKTNRFNWT